MMSNEESGKIRNALIMVLFIACALLGMFASYHYGKLKECAELGGTWTTRNQCMFSSEVKLQCLGELGPDGYSMNHCYLTVVPDTKFLGGLGWNIG